MSSVRGTGPLDAQKLPTGGVKSAAAPASAKPASESAPAAAPGNAAAPVNPAGTARLAGYTAAPAASPGSGAPAAASAPAPAAPKLPASGSSRSAWTAYLTKLAPGIKVVDGKDARWSAAELEAIAKEASKLSPRDAALLGKVSLVRSKEVVHEHSGCNCLADTTVGLDGGATMSFGNSGVKAGLGPLFAHEMGHVAMGDGTYSPTRIREFAKLSQFQDPAGGFQLYAGINWRGHSVNDAPGVVPTRKDNFVSEYAMRSPFEDYAESYRAYYDDPVGLLKKAPDKFLYLNADSGKYSATQVGKLLKDAGLDGTRVATDFARDAWQTGDSIDRILGSNGLKADPRALARTSEQISGMMGLLMGKGAAADAFRDEFGADPRAALEKRGLWSDLSQDIKASMEGAQPKSLANLLASEELKNLIDSQPNAAAQRYIEAGSQRAASYFFSELNDAKGNGWDERFENIATKGIAYRTYKDDWGALHQASARIATAVQTGKPPDFVAKLKSDPQTALGPALWKQLNGSMRAAIADPAFQASAVRRLTSGLAGEEGIAADLEQALYTRGVRDMMKMLLGPDPALRNAVLNANGDAAKAITNARNANGESLTDKLPTSLRYVLWDRSGIRSQELQGMLNNPRVKSIMDQMAKNPDSPVAKNAMKLLDSLTVTDTLSFMRSLNGLLPDKVGDYTSNPAWLKANLKSDKERREYGAKLGDRLADSLSAGRLQFAGDGQAA